MKRLLAAIRERRPIVHDAEVTLSGLRVRYEDGREPEVFEWWRLENQTKTAVQMLWGVLDDNGNPVRRNQRKLLLRVRGDEQMNITRRAYFRGIKQALQYKDITISVPNKQSWYLWAWVLVLFLWLLVNRVVQSGEMISREVDQLITDPIYSNEFIGIILVVFVLFVVWGILVFCVLFFPVFLDSLGLPFSLRVARFSRKGLTCIRTNGTRDYHSWHELLPQTKFLSHVSFSDGFTTRLPIRRRGAILCRAVNEIYHKRIDQNHSRVSLVLRIVIYSILVVAASGFVGYVTQNYGNDPFDPNRGLKKAGFVLFWIMCLILFLFFDLAMGKWGKNRAKTKRHMKNALRREGQTDGVGEKNNKV